MPFRVSILFQQTTEANFPTQASPHTAGWSEGYWQNDDTQLSRKINELLPLRARFLSSHGQIVGYRIQQYAINGMKLIAGQSSSIRQRHAGNSAWTGDVPQMSLRAVIPTTNGLNKMALVWRGVPDVAVDKGEYSPTSAFAQALSNFKNQLAIDSWGTVGRNIAAAQFNVVGIAGAALTTAVAIPGAAVNQTSLTLVRVTDILGAAVRGTYLVTAINGNSYTLLGLNLITAVQNSGTVRVASIAFNPVQNVTDLSVRAVVKKVGRPFEQYRGRGSRRKPAA